MDQFMAGFIVRLAFVLFLVAIGLIWWQSHKGHQEHKQRCRDYERSR